MLDLQKKGIQYNILKREVETNRGLYNNLLQRYKEVGIAGGVGTNNIFIVDRATLPGSPFGAQSVSGPDAGACPRFRGWGRPCALA